jgi:dTDP-4-amino-4,6-dideoxygalactose transaminase
MSAATPIRFQRPSFPAAAAIERYLSAAREERWFSNFGPCCRLLHDRLSQAVGCDAIPVVNATLGLIVAIAALRRRTSPNAVEALVPSFAFAASAQAAIWNGLEPVFVDVDPEHWHLSPDALDWAVHERPGKIAVVIALSSFGTPPPPSVRTQWESVCKEAGIPLLVDSAAGFGAQAADGRPIGAQGDAEVISFHAVKPLAVGEGGAVCSRDPELSAEILRRIQFGFDEGRRVTRRHGINAKLSEPSAAIALAALDDFPRALGARRAAAARIIERLPPGFEAQSEHELGTWQFVPIKAPDPARRDAVLASAQGVVELRTYYEPLHSMPAFVTTQRAGELSTTEDLAGRMLSLPMADDLTDAEIDEIAGALHEPASVA